MTDPTADPTTAPTGRLSRRAAVQTYAPPALAVVGATSLNKTSFGTSGKIKVGGGNPNPGKPAGGPPGKSPDGPPGKQK